VNALRVAVVGGGWAGMAAAVTAVLAGHAVTVWEASRQWGGRARAVAHEGSSGSHTVLDNGQHILIGAYTDTLHLMRTVGVEPDTVLHRMPLCMQYPDGSGLRLPNWPAPLDVLAGVLSAKGWSLADKLSMLRTTGRWQRNRFVCDSAATVGDLCQGLSPKVMQTLIEPLCVSALNTPADQASGQVFLRVLKDSLSGASGSSNLLIPTTDLTALFPQPAAAWLASKGAALHLGQRVQTLQHQGQWLVNGETFDAVILANTPAAASQLLKPLTQTQEVRPELLHWVVCADQLRYEAITTVYLQAPGARLPLPLLALHSDANNPAQFVFDRGQIGGPTGLLAFVISASTGEREHLQQQVLQQARNQLAALFDTAALKPVQTIVEKRATFACTPGLERPALTIAPGLLACGDYVDGPYPATLEGAVRSGIATAHALSQCV
jgi:squalene-associated FAD-dependent desaturase